MRILITVNGGKEEPQSGIVHLRNEIWWRRWIFRLTQIANVGNYDSPLVDEVESDMLAVLSASKIVKMSPRVFASEAHCVAKEVGLSRQGCAALKPAIRNTQLS